MENVVVFSWILNNSFCLDKKRIGLIDKNQLVTDATYIYSNSAFYFIDESTIYNWENL